MNSTIVFIVIAIVIGFIGSLYLNKANSWIQLFIAGGLSVYFLVLYFDKRENGSLLMILLAASWIVKIIKTMKEDKSQKKVIS